jgi:hypothetical protein
MIRKEVMDYLLNCKLDCHPSKGEVFFLIDESLVVVHCGCGDRRSACFDVLFE